MRPLFVATVLALALLAPPARAVTDAGGVAEHAPHVLAPSAPELRAPGPRGELRSVRVADTARGGLRVGVSVEGRLRIDSRAFARTVADILRDPRGWRGRGHAFTLVGSPPFDIEVVLASPALTDGLCAPLPTLGRYSCAQGRRAVLNWARWQKGAPSYANLRHYRIYMVNHEVGHVIGRAHAWCPAAGAPAPVMVQQTKGVAPCRANPWPLEHE